MGVFDSIKQAFQNHFDKNKEEQEMLDRVRKETQIERLKIFEEELKKNSLEVARGQAKKDAASKSGLQKLRAENRMRRLNQSEPAPGSFFDKLREHTQKNLARTQENLKRTEEMRGVGKKLRDERNNKITVRKPFGQTNWKM